MALLTPHEMTAKLMCEHCKVRLAVKKIWLRDLWRYYCNTCWK